MADLHLPASDDIASLFPSLRSADAGEGRALEFLQIIDICLTLSVPWYADKLASKRNGWNAQGLR